MSADPAVAVDRRTGEIVSVCTADEARVLTDRIKASAETLWSLLLEAHQRKAWKALGYARWEDYVSTEFNISRGRAYQVLDQARVIREIESAVSTTVDINEREVRDLKPVLTQVVTQIRDRVADLPDPQPEQVRNVVADVIADSRPQHSRVTRNLPRASAAKSIPQALSSLHGIALAFRTVSAADLADVPAEDASAWIDDLTEVIRALGSIRKMLQERA